MLARRIRRDGRPRRPLGSDRKGTHRSRAFPLVAQEWKNQFPSSNALDVGHTDGRWLEADLGALEDANKEVGLDAFWAGSRSESRDCVTREERNRV